MSFRALIGVASICIILMLSPANAAESSLIKESSHTIEPQKAHDFIAYLVKIGVIDINPQNECYSVETAPETAVYEHEKCISILRVNYNCNDSKLVLISETRIDWRYISEIELSGYNHDGKEIKISGNITTSKTKGLALPEKQVVQAIPARQSKLIFDSPVTARRALNAFKLLRKTCDTSADYPF